MGKSYSSRDYMRALNLEEYPTCGITQAHACFQDFIKFFLANYAFSNPAYNLFNSQLWTFARHKWGSLQLTGILLCWEFSHGSQVSPPWYHSPYPPMTLADCCCYYQWVLVVTIAAVLETFYLPDSTFALLQSANKMVKEES